MMGLKSRQSQVHYAVPLDQLVPAEHFVRRLYTEVDFSFVRRKASSRYSSIGSASVDPEVLLKLIVLGYWEGIRGMRQLCPEMDG